MLLRRYGSRLQSVELNFDSKALNEIGFRRDHQTALDAVEFEAGYTPVGEHAFATDAEGDVHGEVEQAALDELEARIRELVDGLPEDHVVVVENDQGSWPKTRQSTSNVVVEGENRLHFRVHIDPPLRLGVYRPTA